MEHGVEEAQPGVHPNILNEYYGTDQSQEAEVNTRIAEDQAGSIPHDGVNVPTESSPFTAAQEAVFWKALDDIERLNLVPNGHGVVQTGRLNGKYPT